MRLWNVLCYFRSKNLYDYIYYVEGVVSSFKGRFFYAFIFGSFGAKSWLKKPDRVFGPRKIHIGDGVKIEKGSVLYAIGEHLGRHNGEIHISDNVYANSYLNITVASCVKIGTGVALGPNVTIMDFNHDYLDVNRSILQTGLSVTGPIEVGENSWIGANVFITGGVTLGKHCVVAANSVVTKSFPDYSVIAGIPAALIKYYDVETKTWVKVEK